MNSTVERVSTMNKHNDKPKVGNEGSGYIQWNVI